MKTFAQYAEARKTMVMPKSEMPDIQDILRKADEWAAQKKAEGWTREDFTRELYKIAPTLSIFMGGAEN